MFRGDRRAASGVVFLLILGLHGCASTHATISAEASVRSLSSSLSLLRSAARGVSASSPTALPSAAARRSLDDAFDCVLHSEPHDLVPAHEDSSVMDAHFHDLLLSDEGIRDWFSDKYDAVRGLRNLPATIASAESVEAEAEEGLDVTDVVGAVLFGLFDGITMGLGGMYRDAIREYKEDAECQAHSGEVKTAFDALRAGPARFLRGLFGSSRERGGKGRVDFTASSLKSILLSSADLGKTIMALVSGCAPLRKMLLPIIFLVLIGLIMTLVLFILPGFGIVLKIAGILLSVIFGVKHLVKVGGDMKDALGRCVRDGGCSKADKVVMIESFAQIGGLLISIIFLSGIREALRTPNLAQHFTRSAMMLHLRIAFTPRWSSKLGKLLKMLDAIKNGGAGAARGELKVITADSSLADDAAKIADDTANVADDTAKAADDAAAAKTADDTARGAEQGKAIVDDVADDTARAAERQAEAVAAQAKVSKAQSDLNAAERSLRDAKARAASWKPGPPREYTRAVHVGNGKFETRSFGTVSQSNPHSNAVATAQSRVNRLRKALAEAGDEVANVAAKHADEGTASAGKSASTAAAASSASAKNLRDATGKLADDVSSLGKATDDVAAIKARSCGRGMMLLDVGNAGICMVDIFQSRNEIDFSVRKLMRIKDDIKKGLINKDAVDIARLDDALTYKVKAGIDLDSAAGVADDAALSPLVKKALGIDKPNATVNDVVEVLSKGGLEPWKARRLAKELDDAVKAVQRADSHMETAKVAYVKETDPFAAQALGQIQK